MLCVVVWRCILVAQVLMKSFDTYNGHAAAQNDPWGKKFFPAVCMWTAVLCVYQGVGDQQVPFKIVDSFYVAMITPVIHYCMGGVDANSHSEVVGETGVVR